MTNKKQRRNWNKVVVGITRYMGKIKIGDDLLSPLTYFKFKSPTEKADLGECMDRYPMMTQAKALIVGGGGLCYFHGFLNMLGNVINGKLIGWGIGTDLKGYTDTAYPNSINKFDLLGVRDYTTKQDWVACPSCMSGLYQKHYEIQHDFAIYQDKDRPIPNPDNFPVLNSRSLTFDEILYFIGSSAAIITNDYHGVYWSTLLGRKSVIYRPDSSWCHWLKWPVPFANTTEEALYQVSKARTYPDALYEARASNKAFHQKVEKCLCEPTETSYNMVF